MELVASSVETVPNKKSQFIFRTAPCKVCIGIYSVEVRVYIGVLETAYISLANRRVKFNYQADIPISREIIIIIAIIKSYHLYRRAIRSINPIKPPKLHGIYTTITHYHGHT